MKVPHIDVGKVDQGIAGVRLALLNALAAMGDVIVAYFLERVPERGEALWVRYKASAKGRGLEFTFTMFVIEIVRSEPEILLLPYGCLHDDSGKRMLLPLAQHALKKVGIRADSDIVRAHFGEGPAYEAVRMAVCDGCGLERCPHWKRQQ